MEAQYQENTGGRGRVAPRALRRAASRSCLALLVLAGVLAAPLGAQANPSPQDKAVARSLFDDGRKLAAAGKHAEACVKFEDSNKLDPGLGTTFNLADCYERLGKTASAWSLFLEVASLSKAAGQKERETVARARAAALEPKLVRFEIQVPSEARLPGLAVRLNGALLGSSSWGVPFPVDPGPQVVLAEAPDMKPWTTTVQVTTSGQSIALPRLVQAVEPPGPPPPVASAEPRQIPSASASPPPPPPPAASARPAPSTHGSVERSARPAAHGAGGTQRAFGWVSGALGLVSLGVGGYFAWQARSKYDDSEPYCRNAVCLERGATMRDEAVSAGNLSTIFVSAGGGLVVLGTILLVTAPSGSQPPNGARASVTVRPSGIALQGVF